MVDKLLKFLGLPTESISDLYECLVLTKTILEKLEYRIQELEHFKEHHTHCDGTFRDPWPELTKEEESNNTWGFSGWEVKGENDIKVDWDSCNKKFQDLAERCPKHEPEDLCQECSENNQIIDGKTYIQRVDDGLTVGKDEMIMEIKEKQNEERDNRFKEAIRKSAENHNKPLDLGIKKIMEKVVKEVTKKKVRKKVKKKIVKKKMSRRII